MLFCLKDRRYHIKDLTVFLEMLSWYVCMWEQFVHMLLWNCWYIFQVRLRTHNLIPVHPTATECADSGIRKMRDPSLNWQTHFAAVYLGVIGAIVARLSGRCPAGWRLRRHGGGRGRGGFIWRWRLEHILKFRLTLKIVGAATEFKDLQRQVQHLRVVKFLLLYIL